MGGSALIGAYMLHNATTNITNKMNQDKAQPPSDAPPSDGSTSSPSSDSAAASQGAKDKLSGNTGDCGTGNCDDSKNKKRKITGYSAHALKRMQERGMTPVSVQDAVDNPVKITLQANGNTEFVGRSATAVLSPNNWLVTVY